MKTWTSRHRYLPAIAMLSALPATSAPGQERPAEPAPPAAAPATTGEDDLESLGKAASRFVAAFNAKDSSTIAGLYGSQTTYTDQLRRLEDYSRAVPDDAATRFLLGYHYLVCAHLDQAYEQFDQAAKLQPADTIAAQLRDLCKSSISPDTGDSTEVEAPLEDAPAPAPVPADKLVGTWVSDRGENGKVTLNLAADGKFTWTFSKGDQKNDLSGDFSIDERGLLDLASEDSQMVGEIKLPEDTKLNFILAGGPQGDLGLNFDRTP